LESDVNYSILLILLFIVPPLKVSCEIRQNLGRMTGRVRFIIDSPDTAVRPHQHGHTFGFFLIGALRGAIGHGHRPVGIAQQIGAEPDLLAPAFQIVQWTEGNAQDRGVFCLEVGDSITEPAGLDGSVAAEGAWIEPHQDVFAGLFG
jgi:hypothetical protein